MRLSPPPSDTCGRNSTGTSTNSGGPAPPRDIKNWIYRSRADLQNFAYPGRLLVSYTQHAQGAETMLHITSGSIAKTQRFSVRVTHEKARATFTFVGWPAQLLATQPRSTLYNKPSALQKVRGAWMSGFGALSSSRKPALGRDTRFGQLGLRPRVSLCCCFCSVFCVT